MNVLYRSDTSTPFCVVPNSFVVTQPIDSLTFFRKFADFYEYTVVDAGALLEGKMLWGLLRTGHERVTCTGEKVTGHMLLSAHCDSAIAAFLNPLCVLPELNITFPASSRALPPVPLPWNSEFLTP